VIALYVILADWNIRSKPRKMSLITVFVTRFKWFTGKCFESRNALISHFQCRRGPLMSKADKAQAAAAANVLGCSVV
jgi:hypothetical protein